MSSSRLPAHEKTVWPGNGVSENSRALRGVSIRAVTILGKKCASIILIEAELVNRPSRYHPMGRNYHILTTSHHAMCIYSVKCFLQIFNDLSCLSRMYRTLSIYVFIDALETILNQINVINLLYGE